MIELKNLLTEDEWELLCDCCALCCLYKVQDEDTNEVFYTSVVCPYLNKENAHCSCYAQRFKKMPTCMKISPDSLPKMAHWLPRSCAYRCLFEGIQLPEWHPIFSDSSKESAVLRKKLDDICVRPNTCIGKAKVTSLIQNSKAPKSLHKLTRLLLANVIEDTEI